MARHRIRNKPHVERQRGTNLPIILEEDSKLILPGIDNLPFDGLEVFPLGEVFGVLQEVDLLRVVDRAGEEVEEPVRQRLIIGYEIGKLVVLEKAEIGFSPAPPAAWGIGAVGEA